MLITSFHVSNSEKVVFDFQFRLLFFFSCFHPDFSLFLRSKSFKLKSRVRNEKRFELKLLLPDSTRPLNKFLAFVMKIPISSSALTTHSPGNLISLWKATVSKQHTIRIAGFMLSKFEGISNSRLCFQQPACQRSVVEASVCDIHNNEICFPRLLQIRNFLSDVSGGFMTPGHEAANVQHSVLSPTNSIIIICIDPSTLFAQSTTENDKTSNILRDPCWQLLPKKLTEKRWHLESGFLLNIALSLLVLIWLRGFAKSAESLMREDK